MVPAYWNKGVAAEITDAHLKQNPIRHKTIFAAVFQDNLASVREPKHCGFDYVGDVETYSFARQAIVYDLDISEDLWPGK